ncbi:hypothetical protein DYB37_008264 [Aphanomyces astaci]|uniref:Uncharacterized protein n=1 Tax=Aphanomyces astaci TaxID=112090 RepID=A0A3R7B0F8_APHAT|nr:hypothetical protein DYB37_008264 [Aphanomyces astaci]
MRAGWPCSRVTMEGMAAGADEAKDAMAIEVDAPKAILYDESPWRDGMALDRHCDALLHPTAANNSFIVMTCMLIGGMLDLYADGYPVTPDEMLGSGCASQSDCGYLPGLACVRSTCTLCDVDADCGATPSDTSKRCVVDHGTTTVTSVDGTTTTFRPNSVCMEKNLFDPFTTHDAVASLLAFLCTALGSAAGTGGGGLLVPMYILAFGLGPKHAVPMSKTTIFGGAIATLMVNVMKKHPCTNRSRRPLIDYTLSAMMEPPTLIGTIFGVMGNATFPSWLILGLLLALLSFMAVRTLQKVQHVCTKLHKIDSHELL